MALDQDKHHDKARGRPIHRLRHGRLHYGAIEEDSLVRRRLFYAGFALVTVTLVGALGFWLLGEGHWSFEDCAYMVLITITSVGYREVLPIADVEYGRIFTMLVVVCGMGVSFYFLSALTAFIIEGDLREALWRRRMHKRLLAMRDHFVLCGAGRTGSYVTDELLRAGCDLVIVELDGKCLDRLIKKHGETFIAIEGDATDDQILREAGVERACGLVTALEHDQDNLFVSLSARDLNADLRIVSRANVDRVTPKLRQAGANAVVSPSNIGGRRMAHELLRPNVVGFLDFMSRDLESQLEIEEVEVFKGNPLVGLSLAKSRIREVSNALVLSVVNGGSHTYNPGPEFEFDAGMTLIVLGESAQVERLRRYVAGERGSYT
ncbi:MAG: potassium channel protein [Deltaproteobacteria bacterium]|nr:potassium channel protein [Deltaproteobacteria bacterium]